MEKHGAHTVCHVFHKQYGTVWGEQIDSHILAQTLCAQQTGKILANNISTKLIVLIIFVKHIDSFRLKRLMRGKSIIIAHLAVEQTFFSINIARLRCVCVCVRF